VTGVPVRLEPAEFNLLWSRLGLPARPLELNVPAQGATLTEAARLTARLLNCAAETCWWVTSRPRGQPAC
jgi:hypothetical protein